MIFEDNNINLEIKKRLYDPSYYGGLIGITGRLIKRSMLIKNNLFFQNGLRYLEMKFSRGIFYLIVKKLNILSDSFILTIHIQIKKLQFLTFINGYPIQNFKVPKNMY